MCIPSKSFPALAGTAVGVQGRELVLPNRAASDATLKSEEDDVPSSLCDGVGAVELSLERCWEDVALLEGGTGD